MEIVLGNIAKNVGKFRHAADDAGRADIPITIMALGDPTIDTLHGYRELGIEREIVGSARTGWDDPSTTMAFVDRYAGFVAELA